MPGSTNATTSAATTRPTTQPTRERGAAARRGSAHEGRRRVPARATKKPRTPGDPPERAARLADEADAEERATRTSSRPRVGAAGRQRARRRPTRTTSTSGTPASSAPTGAPDAIEFIDVHKAFGRNRILRGLNMGLPEGKISMILGPSGTGKSVCIKHMVGLLYPDEGDVLVHGESVPNMADDELFEMRKKFGVLFQDGALFGSMNLFDNVAFPLRQHTDKGEDEIGEIVNRRLTRGRPRRRRRQDAERALGRHAQARRVRARARARPRHRALRRARLGPRPGAHRAAVRADPGDPRGERRRVRA